MANLMRRKPWGSGMAVTILTQRFVQEAPCPMQRMAALILFPQ